MEPTTAIAIGVLVWQSVLTIAVVKLHSANKGEREELAKRFHRMDLREALHDVTRLLSRKAVHDDARLREAVERLITRMEADPLTAERYRIDLTALKEQIR